jgi:hypothetical protein
MNQNNYQSTKKIKIMKKIIFILSIFLIHAIELSAQHANKPIRVKIDFLIAAPRQDCAGGIGICKITAGVELRPRIAPTGIAYVDDAMYLIINKSTLSTELKNELSKITSFPIEENYALTASQSKALGFSYPIFIGKGSYKLINEETAFVIIPNVIK